MNDDNEKGNEDLTEIGDLPVMERISSVEEREQSDAYIAKLLADEAKLEEKGGYNTPPNYA
jgi:hypothetical protein